jgi:hypothetical protein
MTIPGATVPTWPPLVLVMPRPVPLDDPRYDCDERTTLISFLGRPGPRPCAKVVKTHEATDTEKMHTTVN